MTTPVDLARRDYRKRLERIVGQALLEGADEAAVDTYLADVCTVSEPEKFRHAVQSKTKAPRLGELDWKQLGGRDAFRTLFGLPPVDEPAAPPPFELPPPCSLDDAESVIRRWFGDEYDMDAARAALACAAVNRLDGDPLWLLLVSGPGFTKTETVSMLAGAGACITSTIGSEAALLSGTSKKDATKDATGGLLKKLGVSGVLVLKDFTTILSMNRDARAAMLAALREIHDGKWERNLGTDGGKTLTWNGRIILVGAVTTAWDSHHAVIASMGDRFALLRIDSGDADARLIAGQQSLDNLGDEVEMRESLQRVVGGVIAGAATTVRALVPDEHEVLLAVANFVTLARTACEYDYHGRLEMAHMPEAPTRFVKQLAQIMRGALAIGLDSEKALALAMRVAADSMPPARLAIARLLDRERPNGLSTKAIARELDQPYSSVDKQLQSLHALRVLSRVAQPTGKTTDDGTPKTMWVYTLPSALPAPLKGDTPAAPPIPQNLPLDEEEVPF
jgi:hypothetical protein